MIKINVVFVIFFLEIIKDSDFKMSEDDEKKRKRERNNESVRKCRQNEKKKISGASEELVRYKQEYKELERKYENLQKELQVLKSLFHAPTTSSNQVAASTSTATNISSNLILGTIQNAADNQFVNPVLISNPSSGIISHQATDSVQAINNISISNN